MSQQAAQEFMVRLRADEAFAQRLADLREDPEAVRAVLAAEGVDATPEEIRDVFLEEFGDQLTEEQLAAVSGGLEAWEITFITLGTGTLVGVGLTFGVAATLAVAAAI